MQLKLLYNLIQNSHNKEQQRTLKYGIQLFSKINMKRIILVCIIALFALASCKQEQKPVVKLDVKENVRYKLFPTENMWTFLKLDTRNGLIWQVQYTIKDDSFRGEVELNETPLAAGGEAENGRFTLYPTKNMFTFILLDQKNGKMWQTQWSMEDGNRGIIPLVE